MAFTAQDAKRLSLLFDYGAITAEEVIAWADSMIASTDSPPDMLIELSTTPPDQTGDIVSRLHDLGSTADFWMAFRSALGFLHDYVASHPERAEGIANQLFLTACMFSPSKMPGDLYFVYRFDDAFTLASDGICGDPKTVYNEFLSELRKFK